jgi:DNA-directed RNA polymerase subunit delta
MKRVIVDYKKLNDEILSLLVAKYPDGYANADIIRFKNAYNETIEAVEVRTNDTIYLVKISTKLADSMENEEEDDRYEEDEETSSDSVEIPEEEQEEDAE